MRTRLRLPLMILLRKSKYLHLILVITKLTKNKKKAKSPRKNLQKNYRRVLTWKRLKGRLLQKLIELSKQLSGKGKLQG